MSRATNPKVTLWRASMGRVKQVTVETREDGKVLTGCSWRNRIELSFGEGYFETERQAWDWLLKLYQQRSIDADKKAKNAVKALAKFNLKYISYRESQKEHGGIPAASEEERA